MSIRDIRVTARPIHAASSSQAKARRLRRHQARTAMPLRHRGRDRTHEDRRSLRPLPSQGPQGFGSGRFQLNPADTSSAEARTTHGFLTSGSRQRRKSRAERPPSTAGADSLPAGFRRPSIRLTDSIFRFALAMASSPTLRPTSPARCRPARRRRTSSTRPCCFNCPCPRPKEMRRRMPSLPVAKAGPGWVLFDLRGLKQLNR
jgi:hypothetical protein